MIDPDSALTFLSFVEERHRVWEKRQAGLPAPWTDDPILASKKFTNVFRAIDPGSQFLLTDLLDPELDERETLMRCVLYRFTNRPQTWREFDRMAGRMPLIEDLVDGRVFEAWRLWRASGEQVFSGAYMIRPQGPNNGLGVDKLESIVDLVRWMFTEGDITPDFLRAKTQRERFDVLHRTLGMGDFMSMQILTDWGYSTQCGVDREEEFIIGGPGANRGARALDPDATTTATIGWAVNAIRSSPTCPRLDLGEDRVRLPSLMDVQNCLCEYSKYVRYQSRGSAQQPYQPANPGIQLPPVLPSHWI